jgi:hypothetical protein
MKAILLTASLILVLCGSLLGQGPDTFDISTFKTPAGWKKHVSSDQLRISTASSKGPEFCVITMTRSMPSLGNSRKNFDAAWQTLVKAVGVTTAPDIDKPIDTGGGWEVLSGNSTFTKDGTNGVALLVTITGHSTMMNVLVLTNTQLYDDAVTDFIESVTLKAPAPVRQNVAALGLSNRFSGYGAV